MSGVILAHPCLTLKIAGYTDSTGSDEFNLKLSGQRADAVRTFLVEQGLNAASVTSMGMGSADPVASNDTAVGRQQNRRLRSLSPARPLAPRAATSGSRIYRNSTVDVC
jgi:outer membrane protein OmpA-like peptidoglycan-associated protein